MMKFNLAAVAAGLAFCLAGCSGAGGGGAVDPQLAQKLTADMPEAEVRTLLGEPAKVQALKVGDEHVSDTWTYGEGEQLVTVVMVGGKVSAAYVGRNNTPVFAAPEEALDDGDDGG